MFSQPVVGRGGMSVTVPAGSTVTVAGQGTPGIVPVSNSVAIASGPLPAQFIATGLKNANQTIQQRAPGTPLTLLQVLHLSGLNITFVLLLQVKLMHCQLSSSFLRSHY